MNTIFICDRCGGDNASRISLQIYNKNKKDKEVQSDDICKDCLFLLCVRLLDRLPDDEKVLFYKQFMNGVIV